MSLHYFRGHLPQVITDSTWLATAKPRNNVCDDDTSIAWPPGRDNAKELARPEFGHLCSGSHYLLWIPRGMRSSPKDRLELTVWSYCRTLFGTYPRNYRERVEHWAKTADLPGVYHVPSVRVFGSVEERWAGMAELRRQGHNYITDFNDVAGPAISFNHADNVNAPRPNLCEYNSTRGCELS
jgi:hypothetical protein